MTVVVVALAIIFALINPRFATATNFINILTQASYYIIVAVGMTFVITSAGIDLSVGSLLALVTVIPSASPDETRAEEHARLEKLVAPFDLHGVDWELDVYYGKPSVEIVDAVHRRGCDVLVIGSEGRRGLKRLFRANTAEKILRVVPSSILTIHSSAE